MATGRIVADRRGTGRQGHGRELWPLEVNNASFVVSYDRHKVEAMILKLIDLGHYHLGDALRSCKKESARPGVLRNCARADRSSTCMLLPQEY